MAKKYKKYKLVYSPNSKDIYASTSSTPTDNDSLIVSASDIDKAKLIYEKNNNIFISNKGLPTAEDNLLLAKKYLYGNDIGTPLLSGALAKELAELGFSQNIMLESLDINLNYAIALKNAGIKMFDLPITQPPLNKVITYVPELTPEIMEVGHKKALAMKRHPGDWNCDALDLFYLFPNIRKLGSLTYAPEYKTFIQYPLNDSMPDWGLPEICNIKLVPGTTDLSKMFNNCVYLTKLPKFDTSKVTDMNKMFRNCRELLNIPELDTSNVTNMSYMFEGCYELKKIPLLDTSNVTNMSHMFDYCVSLAAVPQLNTDKVMDMSGMFMLADGVLENSFTTLPLLNTANVCDMSCMFLGQSTLKIIPAFDVSKVINFNSMFNGCTSLKEIHMQNINADLNLTWPDSSYHYNYVAGACPLEHDALLEILNNLAPFDPKRVIPARGIKITDVTSLDALVNLFYQNSQSEIRTQLSNLPAVINVNKLSIPEFEFERIAKQYCTFEFGWYEECSTNLDQPHTLTLNKELVAKLTPEEIKIATDKGWKVSNAGYSKN